MQGQQASGHITLPIVAKFVFIHTPFTPVSYFPFHNGEIGGDLLA
jgi:hypothetical protein